MLFPALAILSAMPLLFAAPADTGGSSLAGAPGAAGAAGPAGQFVQRQVTVAGGAHDFAIYVPPGYDASRRWPCIVFLHGSGECGADGLKPTQVGLGPALLAHPERWPFVVVFPQKPQEDEEWEENEQLVLDALGQTSREFSIDPGRVTLAGMSQGGHGTWYIGARHSGLFCCLVPVCAYGQERTIADRVVHLPVWAFHGLKDDIVSPEYTRRIVESIRAERRSHGLDPEGARMTLYPDANHGAWEPAFAEPDLPRWILAQKRNP
jgi:predicted peptidase